MSDDPVFGSMHCPDCGVRVPLYKDDVHEDLHLYPHYRWMDGAACPASYKAPLWPSPSPGADEVH